MPRTLSDNVTFECTVNLPDMSSPIWEVTRSPYFNSQVPLKNPGLQISLASNRLKSKGYIVKEPSQNFSTLNITQQARQKHTPIQVQCIQYADIENMASDYFYVFTYGKYNSGATSYYKYRDG